MIKIILTLLIATVSASASVQSSKLMKLSEQENYVQDISKYLRKQLWKTGHEYVDSSYSNVTHKFLIEHTEAENRHEDQLSAEEIIAITRCLESKTCAAFVIFRSSEYYSGYGQDAHFILLNLRTKKHRRIAQSIYSE